MPTSTRYPLGERRGESGGKASSQSTQDSVSARNGENSARFLARPFPSGPLARRGSRFCPEGAAPKAWTFRRMGPLFSRSFGWGTPHRPSVSGLCGERSRSEVSEPTRLRTGEGYAACGDEAEQEKYKHSDARSNTLQGGSFCTSRKNIVFEKEKPFKRQIHLKG